MSTSKQNKEGKAKQAEDFLFKRPTDEKLEDGWLHMRTRVANPDVAQAIMFYSHLYNKFKITIFGYAVRLLEQLAISSIGKGVKRSGRQEAVEILVAQAKRRMEKEKRMEEAEFDKKFREEQND